MTGKEQLALGLIPIAIAVVTVCFHYWPRTRDAGFFALAAGLVASSALDINFLSQHWYRGTTRGFEVSFVDILAVSLVLSLVLSPRPGESRFFWPRSLAFALAFLLYALVTLAFSQPRLFGWFELSKWARALIYLLAGALYARQEYHLRVLVWALVCAVSFECLLALAQRYGTGIDRVNGTLEHPNSLSLYLLLTAPVLVAALNARWSARLRAAAGIAIALSTIGMVLTASRMGIPAFAVVMGGATLACVGWQLNRRRLLIGAFILLAITAILAKAWDNLSARYAEAGLIEELNAEGVENRGSYLRLAAAMTRDHFFGVGLNNWSYWVSKKYGAPLGFTYEDYDDIPSGLLDSPVEYDWAEKYAPPAHNLAAITAGELGVPGLALLAALWVCWLWTAAQFLWPRSPDPLRRIGVGLFFGFCGVALQSLTEWAFRQTAILFTFFLLVGVLSALHRHRKCGGGISPASLLSDGPQNKSVLTN